MTLILHMHSHGRNVVIHEELPIWHTGVEDGESLRVMTPEEKDVI